MAAASNRKRSAKEYRCSICNKIFDSAEILNSHVTMEHSQKSHDPAGVG
jgi:DNA-directed RNA polymerase subunit RPC12/RpoP